MRVRYLAVNLTTRSVEVREVDRPLPDLTELIEEAKKKKARANRRAALRHLAKLERAEIRAQQREREALDKSREELFSRWVPPNLPPFFNETNYVFIHLDAYLRPEAHALVGGVTLEDGAPVYETDWSLPVWLRPRLTPRRYPTMDEQEAAL